MTNETLKIVLEAEDRASSTLKNTASRFEGLASAAKAAGAVIATAMAAATTAAVVFGKKSFEAFAESEEQITRANFALEQTATKTKDKLPEVQKIMEGVSQAAVKLGIDDEAAALSFAKLYQASESSTQALKDYQLAADLAAFSGRDMESATKAVIQVHAGGTRILKEFGIEVAEGTTTQQALALAYARVEGAAEVMGNTVVQIQKAVSIAWENLKEDVGKVIAEAILPFIDKLTIFINDTAPKVVEATKQVIAPFVHFRETVEFVRQRIVALISYIEERTGIITIFQASWERIHLMLVERVLPVFREFWETLKPYFPFLQELAKVIGVILLGAFIAVVKLIEGTLIVAIETLSVAVEFITALIGGWGDAWETWISIVERAVGWIDRMIEKLKSLDVFKRATGWISETFLGFGGGKAAGGPVSMGTSYLVGERGPELFVPNTSGTIIPSGSGGITINITGNTISSGLDLKRIADAVSDAITQKLKTNARLTV